MKQTLKQQQCRMTAWAKKCFGDDQVNAPRVRALRLLEEAAEFAQSVGVEQGDCERLIAYVYSRPVGEPSQELGGVGVTWLVAASSLGVAADDVLCNEIARVEAKPIEHFAQRNQAKCDAGFGQPERTSP